MARVFTRGISGHRSISPWIGNGDGTFTDVTRATAYIKHPRHAAALDDWFHRTGAPWFPFVPTHTQVCRDELLYEIELETMIPVARTEEEE